MKNMASEGKRVFAPFSANIASKWQVSAILTQTGMDGRARWDRHAGWAGEMCGQDGQTGRAGDKQQVHTCGK
jgi:hypothetical protein